jgi:hypothetical protein
MIARFGVDELHVDAHAIAAALNAALDDIADVQFTSDCLHVERLAFVRKRRISGDYDAASYARKIGREALGDPVDEMLLLEIATQIGEGQHDHREAWRLLFVWQGSRGLRRRTFRAELERLGSNRRRKFIAFAGHGHDETRRLRVGLDLAAQPADQHVDAAIERIGPLPSQSVDQISAAQHPPGMTNELAQQRKFAAGEGNVAAIRVRERASVEIKRKAPEPEWRASRRQCAFRRGAAGSSHELSLGHVATASRF